MPIIINHNLCDEAPECGGIEVCPVKAFYFDKKKKRVAVNKSKCTECIKCTLPDVCPVGCILFARDKKEELKIKKMINEDPRTARWLWQERYGCQPGKTPPKAEIVTSEKFDRIIHSKGYKIIDVWHNNFLDCRLNSPLYSDLLKRISLKIKIYKLDAQKFPKIAKGMNIKKFPSLILYKEIKQILKHSGLLENKKTKDLNKKIKLKFAEVR